MSVSETCKVPGCGKNKTEHAAGEKNDSIHHHFSATGDLEFKETTTKSPRETRGNSQRSGGKVQGVRTIGDPVLRFVLVSKGIISPEELTEAEKVLFATGALHT